MNAFVPFPLTEKSQLYRFLTAQSENYKTWLLKRTHEQDIIGFLIHGDFIPGLPNNIGFNIGLKYTKMGYGTESLKLLLEMLKLKGIAETFAHCFENNIASINVLEKCDFQNLGHTGRIYVGVRELKFGSDIIKNLK
jgi:RimJ/RimL family protein N-acetyltransferase